jgi:YVTN family beta-propeller protein
VIAYRTKSGAGQEYSKRGFARCFFMTIKDISMKNFSLVGVVCLGLSLPAAPAVAQSNPSGYHLVDSLRLGGVGGWDLYGLDTAAQRLYVSRGTLVQVVDCAKDSLIGEIPNTNGVHGIAVAPSAGKGFTSNGKDSSVTVFDLKTLKQLAVIKVQARNPDVILFEPVSKRVFVFNGGSNNAVAIDAATNTVIGTVSFEGKPELAVTDEKGHVFVNLEDKSSVAEFDATTLKVVHVWPLAPGREPTGIAMDRRHRRIFSACANNLMIVLDADSGKVVAQLPIGSGVDGAGFDPSTRYAFSSNGEGTLTVVREDSPAKFSVVENVVTRRGARTMVLDEKTHRIYMLSATFGPPPAPTADHPRPRPSIVPGSVTLYVFGR